MGLHVFALCVVALFLKMFLVSCYQGYHRLRVVAFTNPEDAAVFKRAPLPAERPQVIRAARVWANDLENIPAFLPLAGWPLHWIRLLHSPHGCASCSPSPGACTQGPTWRRCSLGEHSSMGSACSACWAFACSS